MSRIDDDRDAARQADRLAEQKRLDEARARDKKAGSSAFQDAVAKQQQKAPMPLAKGGKSSLPTPENKETPGRRAVAYLLSQERARADEPTVRDSAHPAPAPKSDGDDAHARDAAPAPRPSVGPRLPMGDRAQADARTRRGRQADAEAANLRGEARRSDAKEERRVDERRTESAKGNEATSSQTAMEDAVHESQDKGGGGQQQGGSSGGKKDGGGGVPQGFRYNPALMAPVPVAQKRDLAGSDRLRRIATEIAQRIVERVRVGTNATGQSEFQIDLRGDVLKGLSLKVSASGGKIRAVFSGRDKDVLKLIEEHGDALKEALEKRGLKLDEFRVEALT